MHHVEVRMLAPRRVDQLPAERAVESNCLSLTKREGPLPAILTLCFGAHGQLRVVRIVVGAKIDCHGRREIGSQTF